MSQAMIPYHGQQSTVTILTLSHTHRFLITTKRDKALSTYKTYSSKIKIFNEWLQGFSMTQDMSEDLKAFRSWLTDRYTSANTINLTLSVVRQFYRSLHKRGTIPYDPSIVLENEPENNDTGKNSISREQFYQISTTLKADTSKNSKRNWVLFVLLTMNGLRVSEASNACIEDIELNGGKRVLYLLRKGHRDKSAFVVLQDKTYEMILDFMQDRTGNIFVSSRTGEAMTGGEISRIIKTVFRRCDIDSSKITAHSLRHTYAIFALEGGADLMSLSQSLNHKNLSTTQTYLRSYNRLRNSAEDAINLDF